MKNKIAIKTILAMLLSAATVFSCMAGAFSVSAEASYKIDNVILNTFENETGKGQNSENTGLAKSIDDVYNSYSYAPSGSADQSPLGIARKQYGGVDPSWNATRVIPYYDGQNQLGNNSLGCIRLGYAGNQAANHAHFAIWDNSSEAALHNDKGQPKQVIETNPSYIYRISFDYKVDFPEGYTGKISYAELPNANVKGSCSNTAELVTVTSNDVEWKHCGFKYVQASNAWNIIGISLDMDENEKSAGAYVYIDNLKVEKTSAGRNEKLSKILADVNFVDTDGTSLSTVKALPGLTWYAEEPIKTGYKFAGWVDESGEPAANGETVTPAGGATYTATWVIDGYKAAATYTNTFDNETGTALNADGSAAAKSIDDVYMSYSYAPSWGEKTEHEYARIKYGNAGTPNQNRYYTYPYYNGTDNLGKDSLGCIKMGYPINQTDLHARFVIWNSNSENNLYDTDTTTNRFGQATQTIGTYGNKKTYRISFDYRMEAPSQDYTGAVCFAEIQNWNANQVLAAETPLASVAPTDGEWVHVENKYVKATTTNAWNNFGISLAMDNSEYSKDAYVYIDNLVVEETTLPTDAVIEDSIVTVSMNIDGKTETISGLPGFDYNVSAPVVDGFTFKGWKNANDETLSELPGMFTWENEEYTAVLEFYYKNIKGDINMDNCVDIRDLVCLKKYIAGIEGTTVAEDNAFMTDYIASTYRLVAMRKYLLTDVWTYSDATKPEDSKKKLADYLCVWNDEFDGSSIDESKWKIRTQTDTTEVKYSTDNIKVENGKLNLKTVKNADGTYTVAHDLFTQSTMNFRYGYLEVRAKISALPGAAPALWMKGINGVTAPWSNSIYKPTEYCTDYLTEIDIFERSAYFANSVTPNLHKWYTGSDSMDVNQLANGNKFHKEIDNNSYHIFGFEWNEEKIIMSVDGDEYATFNLNENFDHANHTTDMSGFKDAHYLIIGGGISAKRLSEEVKENATADYVSSLGVNIDWIRLFQPANSIEIYTAAK